MNNDNHAILEALKSTIKKVGQVAGAKAGIYKLCDSTAGNNPFTAPVTKGGKTIDQGTILHGAPSIFQENIYDFSLYKIDIPAGKTPDGPYYPVKLGIPPVYNAVGTPQIVAFHR